MMARGDVLHDHPRSKKMREEKHARRGDEPTRNYDYEEEKDWEAKERNTLRRKQNEEWKKEKDLSLENVRKVKERHDQEMRDLGDRIGGSFEPSEPEDEL